MIPVITDTCKRVNGAYKPGCVIIIISHDLSLCNALLTLLNSTELKMSILSENSLCILLSRLVSMGALPGEKPLGHFIMSQQTA